MSDNFTQELHLFNLSPNLGIPEIFPDITPDKVPITVQFIVPGSNIKKDKEQFYIPLAKKCAADFWALKMRQVEEQRTKRCDTLFTIAFYIPGDPEKINNEIVIQNSRLIVERFIDLLSFVFGIRLSARHIQPYIVRNETQKQLILPVNLPEPKKINLEYLINVEKINPDDDIFTALYWLRRGLAQRDAVETFSALMVCLQIMARKLAEGRPQETSCPKCGHKIVSEVTITSQIRDLIVDKLEENPELFKKLWKARNSIVAHGNQSIKADVLVALTELKFEAIKLAFKSIKLSMGIPFDDKPIPNSSLFITDAFMYTD